MRSAQIVSIKQRWTDQGPRNVKDRFVAALPCANASRLSQAMAGNNLLRHCEATGRRKAPPDDGLREAIHASPSLRATGSRECAPDDRLREAIHASPSLRAQRSN